MKTSDLIEILVADAKPVRRLAPPLVRSLRWLLLPAFVFALLALAHGVRPDLARQLGNPSYLAGIAASLLTAVLAAIASFKLDVPDGSPRWALLPVPALVVWVASIGHGCLSPWVAIVPGSIQVGEAARCFATVLLTSVPLCLGMFVMLRRGGPLKVTTVTLTGSLAVAAMSATAVSLLHELDASAMVLMWNFGTAACVVALGGHFGRAVLVGDAWRPSA
ncbi:MAG: DUF1109 domain-containing protein [Caldimonas sp.]